MLKFFIDEKKKKKEKETSEHSRKYLYISNSFPTNETNFCLHNIKIKTWMSNTERKWEIIGKYKPKSRQRYRHEI